METKCDFLLDPCILGLLKNSMIQINKTASNVHFNEAETDRELIFQTLLEYREFDG